MATKHEVIEQALMLDADARADVVDALLESLEDTGPDDLLTENEVAEEVLRRRQHIRDGMVKPIPWEKARDRLRSEFPDPDDA